MKRDKKQLQLIALQHFMDLLTDEDTRFDVMFEILAKAGLDHEQEDLDFVEEAVSELVAMFSNFINKKKALPDEQEVM